MEQVQYQVTATGEGFRPLKAPSYVESFDESIREFESINEISERSIKTRAQQEVEAAEKRIREVEQLSKLSNKIFDEVTQLVKKRNDSQRAKGFAEELRNPTFNPNAPIPEETALAEGQAQANAAAAEYEKQGGSAANAQTIRNTGGWAGYGRYQAQLYAMGQGYNAFELQKRGEGFSIEVTRADGTKVTVNPQNKDITAEEYKLWQDAVAQDYLKRAPDARDDVATKYLLEPMRRQQADSLQTWSTEKLAEQRTQEKEDRFAGFKTELETKNPAAVDNFIKTHPGGKREGRLEVYQSLNVLVDMGVYTGEEATDILETQTITKDGKQITLAEAFPVEFNSFENEIFKTAEQNITQDNRILKSEAEDLKSSLQNSGPVSEDEIRTLGKHYRFNPFAQEVLKNAITKEDIEIENQMEDVRAKMATGSMTLQQLEANYSPEVYAEMKDEVGAMDRFGSDLSAHKTDMEADVKAAAANALNLESGDSTSTSPEYREAFYRGKQIYQAAYLRARRDGKSDLEARQYAREDLKNKTQSLTAPVDPIKLDSIKVEEGLKSIRTYGASRVIPNTQKELDAAYKYLTTGEGKIPGLYDSIANGFPFTGKDVAMRQLAASGNYDMSKVGYAPKEEAERKLDPRLRSLLFSKPNSGRVAQAMTFAQGSDQQIILDSIASVESGDTYGQYDAYNLGGSDAGHTAHGSGNSAEDGRFGKPISQLTIGEIRRLHNTGQLHAAGRYQFIRPTFAEVADRLGLPEDTKFDAKTQDMFALERVRQRAEWGSLSSGLRSEWIGLQYMNPEKYNRLVQAAERHVRSPYNQPEVVTPGVL